jgi:hypothetical protein
MMGSASPGYLKLRPRRVGLIREDETTWYAREAFALS